MKGKMVLLIAVMVLSLGLVGTPASWANSLTFQNVTFDLSLSGSNLLLRVTNALNATGSWLGRSRVASAGETRRRRLCHPRSRRGRRRSFASKQICRVR